MTTESNKKVLWTGRVISTLSVLPLVVSAVMKIKGGPMITQGFAQSGIPMTMLPILIALEILCVVVYTIPATAVVGAILIAGYMGGAICTGLRIGENVALQTALPILAWLGVYLREPRLRALLPFRK